MSIDIDDFLEIKETLNQKQSDRDRLLGTKEALMEQLNKLGYKTITAAQKGLTKLENQIESEEEKLASDIEIFKEKYGELL